MSGAAFSKLVGSDLAALTATVDLPVVAADAVRSCQHVPEALQALENGGFLAEAARLLSHALPHREAVWWACMCALHTAPADLPQADTRAREAAEAWVRHTTDAARRHALEAAQTAGFGTPEAWAAVAAFWSTGSMAPEGQPNVPPPAHLAGTAVVGAVTLAAVRGDPARRTVRLRRFLESGRDVAAGGAGRLPSEVP